MGNLRLLLQQRSLTQLLPGTQTAEGEVTSLQLTFPILPLPEL